MADGLRPPDRDRSQAVLIGVSRFDRLTPLPAVRKNLRDLKAALTHPEHGIISPANCEVVDGPRGPRDLMTSLRSAARRTDDLLLVYYAGHGLRHDTRDELYLTVSETDADALAESAVPFHVVKEVLEESTARTNLLVLDCCYSGMALSAMSGVPVDAREIAVSGSAVLASSPKNRKSHSPAGNPHTAFTGKMISLLQDGSPNEDEQLTVHVLYRRISAALVREELPRPLMKLTDTSGELLVRRSAPAPLRPPPPPPAEPAPLPTPAEPTPSPLADDSTTMSAPSQVDQPTTTEPAAHDPSPSRTTRTADFVKTQFKVRLWQALWILAGLGFAMTASGLVGVLGGEKTSPPSNVAPGSIVGIGGWLLGLSALALVLLRWRWGRFGQGAMPQLSRSTAGRVTLVVGALFFLAVAVTVPFSNATSGAPTYSPSSTVGTMLSMAEAAGACLFLLYRGEKLRRRTNRR